MMMMMMLLRVFTASLSLALISPLDMTPILRAHMSAPLLKRRRRRLQLHGRGMCRRGIPAALPAPGALLAGFQERGLPAGDPLGAALEVGTQEVADAVGMLEGMDVDGEGRQDLQDAVDEDPAAKTGLARCGVLEVCGHLKLLEFVDEGGA
jgi:hypothetical protein